MHSYLSKIIQAIQPQLVAINQHKVFFAINSMQRLRRFAEMHVYAVWDFMCLLKALQRQLSSSQLLWLPPQNHLGCHLVNGLLAEEESDVLSDNRYLSHFELYLQAMQECGADSRPINKFITHVRQQQSLDTVLLQSEVPVPAQRFIRDTFSIISKDSHDMAASLAFARELITSGMFSALLHNLPDAAPYSLRRFKEYFQRHIELDGDKHSQQSQLLVAELCGQDETKWQQATASALFSLQSRLRLLDEVHNHVLT